jgi:CHAT domain
VTPPAGQRRIYMRVNEDATQAWLETDTGYPDRMPFCLPGENLLSEVRDGLTEQLSNFREMVPDKLVGFPEVEQALNALRDLGTYLANRFFGGSEQVEAAQWFFRKAVPDWRVTDGADLAVVFDAPLGAMFPVELLPIFDYSDEWKVTDTASLAATARKILGFGAVVSRVVQRLPYSGAGPGTVGQLRLRMFQDLSLTGAQLETAAFGDMPRLHLDGPWPGSLPPPGDLAGFIARATLDSAQQLDGSIKLERFAHFVHFACHGDTSQLVPGDYRIRIQGRHGGAHWVTLRQLGTRMTQHYVNMPGNRRALPRPVVVMNSCGSAHLDPRTAASFPYLFLTEHLGGFIGPEAPVPDEVAADFSRQFYAALTRRTSVGQALHQAKWTLLSRWSNPLGILWAAYVDPDYRPVG